MKRVQSILLNAAGVILIGVLPVTGAVFAAEDSNTVQTEVQTSSVITDAENTATTAATATPSEQEEEAVTYTVSFWGTDNVLIHDASFTEADLSYGAAYISIPVSTVTGALNDGTTFGGWYDVPETGGNSFYTYVYGDTYTVTVYPPADGTEIDVYLRAAAEDYFIEGEVVSFATDKVYVDANETEEAE